MSQLNLFVFLTLCCWGIWGIIDKKALEYGKQEDVMMRLYLLSFLWVPISFLSLNHFEPGWHLNGTVILWTGLASCAYVVALLAYLAAMSEAEASYVLGMTAAYPLIFQILANLVLHEALVPLRMLGALVIGTGLFLISGSNSKKEPAGNSDAEKAIEATAITIGLEENNRHSLEEQSKKTRKATDLRILLYVTTATLTWGVYGLFDKKAVAAGSPLLVFFSKTLWDFLLFFVLLLMYSIRKKKIDWKERRTWLFCFFSECCLGFGGLTYLSALSMASASYVISITGCYPLLMYLFAIWLLKEQFNKLRFCGIVLVVIGGALVQLTAP